MCKTSAHSDIIAIFELVGMLVLFEVSSVSNETGTNHIIKMNSTDIGLRIFISIDSKAD